MTDYGLKMNGQLAMEGEQHGHNEAYRRRLVYPHGRIQSQGKGGRRSGSGCACEAQDQDEESESGPDDDYEEVVGFDE